MARRSLDRVRRSACGATRPRGLRSHAGRNRRRCCSSMAVDSGGAVARQRIRKRQTPMALETARLAALMPPDETQLLYSLVPARPRRARAWPPDEYSRAHDGPVAPPRFQAQRDAKTLNDAGAEAARSPAVRDRSAATRSSTSRAGCRIAPHRVAPVPMSRQLRLRPPGPSPAPCRQVNACRCATGPVACRSIGDRPLPPTESDPRRADRARHRRCRCACRRRRPRATFRAATASQCRRRRSHPAKKAISGMQPSRKWSWPKPSAPWRANSPCNRNSSRATSTSGCCASSANRSMQASQPRQIAGRARCTRTYRHFDRHRDRHGDRQTPSRRNKRRRRSALRPPGRGRTRDSRNDPRSARR